MSKKLIALGTMALYAIASASVALAQPGEGAAPTPPTAGKTDFTVISIEHIPVEEAHAIIMNFFPHPTIVSSPLSSTNQLIVRADERTIEAIQALLAKIDKPASPTAAAWSTSNKQAKPLEVVNRYGLPTRGDDAMSDRDDLPFRSDRYLSAEKEAQDTANELREALRTMGKDHPQVVQLRSALEHRVNALFQQRQEAHARRIQELENKLQTLHKKMDQQEQSRKRIIEQRIEQLMSGQVPPSVQRPRPTQNSNTPPLGTGYTLSLNVPDPDVALSLLAQLAETQNRIAKAEAEYAAVTADYERAKAEFERPDVSKPARLKRQAEARRMDAQRKAALAEIEAARKLHQILETQVATHRELLRNDLELAQIALSKAQRELDRASTLEENHAISESQMDAIRVTVDQARLKFERAKKILDAFEGQSK